MFLYVGGGITILVIVFYLASAWIPSREGLSATVDYKKKFLLKEKETLSQEEAFKARVAQDEERLAQNRSRLLPGDNPAIAASALQKVLQDIADQSGVEIQSKTVQPEQKLQDNITKISIQLSVNASVDQLVRFLAGIENYEKFLRVEELNIQSTRLQKKDEIRPQVKVVGYVATSIPAAKPPEKGPGSK